MFDPHGERTVRKQRSKEWRRPRPFWAKSPESVGIQRLEGSQSVGKEQIQQYGYTVDTVRQTIPKNFAAKGLSCVSNGEKLSFIGCGSEENFSNMWPF